MMISRSFMVRVLIDSILFVPIAFAIYLCYLLLQRTNLPSGVYDIEVATPMPVRPGDVVQVNFKAIRLRTCTMEISRIIDHREDKKEFQISFSNQLIEATPYPIQSSYRVTIPTELTTGTYWLYTRYRYYCNGLDFWFPFIKKTEPIRIDVVAP